MDDFRRRDKRYEDWDDEEAPRRRGEIAPGKVSTTSRIPDYVFRDDDGGGPIAGDSANKLQQAGGGSGAPLPGPLRQRLEQSLDADLSGVRVHTGADSEAADKSLRANAFAVGDDIHFGRGKYEPSSSAGERLIAHEVAHTVQHGPGAGPSLFSDALSVSAPGDQHEREAEAFADAFIRNDDKAATPAVTPASAVNRSVISRDQGDGETPVAADFNYSQVAAVRNKAAGLSLEIALVRAQGMHAYTQLKTKLLQFCTNYREAYNEHKRVLAEAHEAAEEQEAAWEIAEGIVFGVVTALTLGAAAEFIIGAEVVEGLSVAGAAALHAVEGGVGALATHEELQIVGTPAPHAEELEAVAVTPDAMRLHQYHALERYSRSLGRLNQSSIKIGNIQSVAEYCIGEIKANLGDGSGADLSTEDTEDLVRSVLATDSALTTAKSRVNLSKAKVAGLQATADLTEVPSREDLEKRIWTDWMASLPHDSDLLDLDPIENHLRPLGLVHADIGNIEVYYSDDEEEGDLRSARTRRRENRRDQQHTDRDMRRAARRAQNESLAASRRADEHTPEPETLGTADTSGTMTAEDFGLAQVEAIRGQASGLVASIALTNALGGPTQHAIAHSLGGYSRHYRVAWGNFSGVLRRAQQEARETAEMVNVLSGMALGAIFGVAFGGAENALEHAGHELSHLAEVAIKAVEKTGEGVTHHEIHSHAEELEPEGISPDAISADVLARIMSVNEALAGLNGATFEVTQIASSAEYCIGEIRGHISNGVADMSETEVKEMADALIACGEGMGSMSTSIESVRHSLTTLRSATQGAHIPSASALERQLWILWIAELPADSNGVLDNDVLEDYLRPKGLVSPAAVWYSDADEHHDIASARRQADGLRAHASIMNPGAAGGGGHGGGGGEE